MRPQQHITDDSDEMYKIYRRRKVRINLQYCYKVYVMYSASFRYFV